MKRLPHGWHIYQHKALRDPERELRRLRERFGDVSRRFGRAVAFRRMRSRTLRQWRTVALWGALAVAVPIVAIKALSPWPAELTTRHLAAARNCDAARAVGLAPAVRGGPGYYEKHDRDNDGIACETWR